MIDSTSISQWCKGKGRKRKKRLVGILVMSEENPEPLGMASCSTSTLFASLFPLPARHGNWSVDQLYGQRRPLVLLLFTT